MKRIFFALLVTAIPTLFAGDPKVTDTAVGDLTMLHDPYAADSGFKDVELFDDGSGKIVHLPAGRYSSTKIGSAIQIKDERGAPVAAISLKHATVDEKAHTFSLSVAKSKNPLDVYGGQIYRPLSLRRYGKPAQECTISCCTTTTECDDDGKNCHSVCHDCSGTRDEVWQDVKYRWDYEIFFGKPGSYEIAVFNAKGQPKSKSEKLEEESCQ